MIVAILVVWAIVGIYCWAKDTNKQDSEEFVVKGKIIK